MKPSVDHLLEELTVVTGPAVEWKRVEAWVRAGRTYRRFHLSTWLSRVWRRPRN